MIGVLRTAISAFASLLLLSSLSTAAFAQQAVEPASVEKVPPTTDISEKALEVTPLENSKFVVSRNTVGFGFGINAPVAGDAAPFKIGSKASIKWWINDFFAIEPMLKLYVSYSENESEDTEDLHYKVLPGAMFVFAAYRGKSTRLNTGVGISVSIEGMNSKTGEDNGDRETIQTTKGFDIPVMLAVEHFFVDWFSISAGVEFDALSYDKSSTELKRPDRGTIEMGPVHTVKFDIDSTNLFLNVMFYTN